jgi:predicted Na+-dependent transporter
MHKNKHNWLIILSIAAVLIAAYNFFTKSDVLNLAGTQWILIAIVFGIYALYSKTGITENK